MNETKKGRSLKRITITLLIGLVLISIFYFTTGAISKYTGYVINDDEDFESCLRGQDVTVYINSKDTTSTLRGLRLRDYIDHVKIINCERNPDACLNLRISKFPTWIVNGNRIERDILVKDLSQITGCK